MILSSVVICKYFIYRFSSLSVFVKFIVKLSGKFYFNIGCFIFFNLYYLL